MRRSAPRNAGPGWLVASVWAVRHWRALAIGIMAGIATLGLLMVVLGLASAPGGGSQFLIVAGVIIAGSALLRLPATIRFARRTAMRSSRAIRVRRGADTIDRRRLPPR